MRTKTNSQAQQIRDNQNRLLALKEIANENIDYILDALGLELRDQGSYLNGSCPIHGGDNATAFSFSRNTGTWKCWTKGCHSKVGTDIFSLVRIMKGMNFPESVAFIEQFLKIDKDKLKDVVEKVKNAKFVRQQTIVNPDYYDEDCLKELVDRPYLRNRGFSQEIIDKYQVGYCADTDHDFYDRVIVPVRDEHGGLVGFTGRISHDDYVGNVKWKHEGKMHNYLFNYNNAKPFIKEKQVVVVVEGPWKVMKLEELGIRNSVAIFGTSLSDKQLRILLESGAFTVILIMDNDEAGRKASDRIRSTLEQYFYVHDIIPPVKDFDRMELAHLKGFLEDDEICKTLLK